MQTLALAALIAAALAAPVAGVAAPPSSKSEVFDAPFRKTLDEYDAGAGASAGRNAFERGVAALENGDLNRARSEFDSSAAAAPSYEAAFNAALSAQLAHRFNDAVSAYAKARRPERPDPELETNLALALAGTGKRDESFKRLDAALAMTDNEEVKGRILYQRALLEYKFGQPLDSLKSLDQAEAAFGAAGDALGRAVVAARRGTFRIAMGGEGGPSLKDAVAELQKVGARVDESEARQALASYDVSVGDAAGADEQLVGALAAAETSGNDHERGQALDLFALYHLRQGKNDAAIKDYESAIDAFRKAHDRLGEGDAYEDLCRLYLASGDLDAGFERCARSARAYRGVWTGPGRAVAAATQFADLFRRLGQEARQKYFLDVGQWLLGQSQPSIAKANLLVGLARYNLNHDLLAAQANAREAHEIYVARHDDDKASVAELIGERITDARNQRLQDAFLWVALLSFFGWIALSARAELGRAMRACARIVAAPFRWAVGGLHRIDVLWTGRPLADADEETRRFDRLRVRLVGLLCMATIVLVVAVDAATITGPNLGYINEIGRTVTEEGEILPPDLSGAIQALLDRDSGYVLLALLVQIVILGIGLLATIILAGAVESGMFGLIDRFLRRAAPQIDADVRKSAAESLRALQRPLVAAWIALAFAMLAIEAVARPSIRFVGLIVLGALVLAEIAFCAGLSRKLGVLPADPRKSAFDYLSRLGLHHVCTVMLGIIACLYVLMPAFYSLANLAQRRLVLPTFADVEQSFYATMSAAVPKYGTFMLDGQIPIAFLNLKKAYEPDAGASHLWWDLLPRLLPYALGVWLILLVSRLVYPIVELLGTWRRVWKTLRIAILAVAVHQAADVLLRYVFQLDEEEFGSKLVIWLTSGLLAVIADHFGSMVWGSHEGEPHGREPGRPGGPPPPHDPTVGSRP